MDCQWRMLRAFEETLTLNFIQYNSVAHYMRSNSCVKRYLANLVASIALPVLASIEAVVVTLAFTIALPFMIKEGMTKRDVKRYLQIIISPICLIVTAPFFLIANIFGANYLPINCDSTNFHACQRAVEYYQKALNRGQRPSFSKLRSFCRHAPNLSEYLRHQPSSTIVQLLIMQEIDGRIINQLQKLVDLLLGDQPSDALAFIVSEDNIDPQWMECLLSSIEHGNPFKLDVNALYNGESLTKKILLNLFKTINLEGYSYEYVRRKFDIIIYGLVLNGLIIKKEELETLPALNSDQRLKLELYQRKRIANGEPKDLLSLLIMNWAMKDLIDDGEDRDRNDINSFVNHPNILNKDRRILPALPALLDFFDYSGLEKIKLAIINSLKSINKDFLILENGLETTKTVLINKLTTGYNDPLMTEIRESSLLIINLIKHTDDFQFARVVMEIENDRLVFARDILKLKANVAKPSGLYAFLKDTVERHETATNQRMSVVQCTLAPSPFFVTKDLITLMGTYLHTQTPEPQIALIDQDE